MAAALELNAGNVRARPDIVIVGNVTEDLTQGTRRIGGTAAYASQVAVRLGLRPAVVTRAPSGWNVGGLLPGVEVFAEESERATVFEEWYEHGRRRQRVRTVAGSISVDRLPASVREASIVLLGPVLDEVDPAAAMLFPSALIGATAQGWLRRLVAGGEVEEGRANDLSVSRIGARLTVLVVSEEDLNGEAVPTAWQRAVPIVIVTLGHLGLRVWHDGRWQRLAAFPAVERDSTGAGDALATGFLVRYQETHDLGESARFASAVASFVVEARGFEGAPTRPEVERRMAAYREIRLAADP